MDFNYLNKYNTYEPPNSIKLKDDSELKPNDYVYIKPSQTGEIYHIGRVMSFHQGNNKEGANVRICRLFRKFELGYEWDPLEDSRALFLSFTEETHPISQIISKCIVVHISYINDLDAYCRLKNHFYFHQYFEKRQTGVYEVLPTELVVSLPSDIVIKLRQMFSFVFTEKSEFQKLQVQRRDCKACGKWCYGPDALICMLCDNATHPLCANPPFKKKMQKWFKYQCSTCLSNAQVDFNDPAQTIPKVEIPEKAPEPATKAIDLIGLLAEPNNTFTKVSLRCTNESPLRYLGKNISMEEAINPEEHIFARVQVPVSKNNQITIPEYKGRHPLHPKYSEDVSSTSSRQESINWYSSNIINNYEDTKFNNTALHPLGGLTGMKLNYDDETNNNNQMSVLQSLSPTTENTYLINKGESVNMKGKEEEIAEEDLDKELWSIDPSENFITFQANTLRKQKITENIIKKLKSMEFCIPTYSQHFNQRAYEEIYKNEFNEEKVINILKSLTPMDFGYEAYIAPDKEFEEALLKFYPDFDKIAGQFPPMSYKGAINKFAIWKADVEREKLSMGQDCNERPRKLMNIIFPHGANYQESDDEEELKNDKEKKGVSNKSKECLNCKIKNQTKWEFVPSFITKKKGRKSIYCNSCAEYLYRYAIPKPMGNPSTPVKRQGRTPRTPEVIRRKGIKNIGNNPMSSNNVSVEPSSQYKTTSDNSSSPIHPSNQPIPMEFIIEDPASANQIKKESSPSINQPAEIKTNYKLEQNSYSEDNQINFIKFNQKPPKFSSPQPGLTKSDSHEHNSLMSAQNNNNTIKFDSSHNPLILTQNNNTTIKSDSFNHNSILLNQNNDTKVKSSSPEIISMKFMPSNQTSVNYTSYSDILNKPIPPKSGIISSEFQNHIPIKANIHEPILKELNTFGYKPLENVQSNNIMPHTTSSSNNNRIEFTSFNQVDSGSNKIKLTPHNYVHTYTHTHNKTNSNHDQANFTSPNPSKSIYSSPLTQRDKSLPTTLVKHKEYNPIQRDNELSVPNNKNNSIVLPIINDQENELECAGCFGRVNNSFNTILKCRFCELAVHYSCYNQVPVSDKNTWICDFCFNLGTRPKILKTWCKICNQELNQPFDVKRTETNDWVHIKCFGLIEGLYKTKEGKLGNINYLINKNTEKCSICDTGNGILIKCKCCNNKFHPTCAIKDNLFVGFDKKDTEQMIPLLICNKHKVERLDSDLVKIDQYKDLNITYLQLKLSKQYKVVPKPEVEKPIISIFSNQFYNNFIKRCFKGYECVICKHKESPCWWYYKNTIPNKVEEVDITALTPYANNPESCTKICHACFVKVKQLNEDKVSNNESDDIPTPSSSVKRKMNGRSEISKVLRKN